MSEKKCVVPGCTANDALGKHQVLHVFPNPLKDKDRFDTWIKLIGGNIVGLDDAHIFKYRRVCNVHFEAKYLCRNNRISNVAIPTINITDPVELPDVKNMFNKHFAMKSARSLITAVFTPLNESLTINYNIIPAYAKYVAESGIKSILVGGTTGEHVTLNVEERKKLIDAWVKNGKPFGLHIQAHVGGAPLVDVLDLAKHCSSAGVDSLLTLSELYFKPNSVDGLVSYIDLVAKAAPNLPVFYYYTPIRNKVEISMPAFVTAATEKIPNFKGLKYAWTDLSEAAQILRHLKDDQQIYSAKETLIAPAALLGIRTFNCTTFNMFPRLAQDIVDAIDKSHVKEARMLQEKYSKAVEAITAEGEWVPTMKAAMEIVTGMKMGPPCLPQKPISVEATNRIEYKLRALELVK